jgi:peptide/nickel transport system permease protein
VKRLRDPVAVLALLLLLVLALAAAFAPWVVSGDPYDNDLGAAMQPPSAEHWLGADDQGRDLVVRVVYGLRLTLLMGAAAVGLGGGIGALVCCRFRPSCWASPSPPWRAPACAR